MLRVLLGRILNAYSRLGACCERACCERAVWSCSLIAEDQADRILALQQTLYIAPTPLDSSSTPTCPHDSRSASTELRTSLFFALSLSQRPLDKIDVRSGSSAPGLG